MRLSAGSYVTMGFQAESGAVMRTELLRFNGAAERESTSEAPACKAYLEAPRALGASPALEWKNIMA